MDTQKSIVNVAIPLRFMKKHESGYLSQDDVVLVVKEGTCVDDFKVECYIKKTACYDRFFTADYVKITKIGDGFTGKDFSLFFPLQRSTALYEREEFCEFDWYKRGLYLEPLDVDHLFNESVEFVLKYSNFSELSFVQMMSLVQNCFELPDFEFYEKRLGILFDHLTPALHNHLLRIGTDEAVYLQHNLLEERRNSDDLEDSAFKEFSLKFYSLSLYDIDMFLQCTSASFAGMSLDQLKVELDRLQGIEDFEGAVKIRDEIQSRTLVKK